MLWLYLATFVLGLGLVAMAVFGLGGDDGPDGDVGLLAIFSLRNLSWGSLAFGGFGLLGHLTGRSPGLTLATAAVAGVGIWLAAFGLVRYLKRSASGDLPGDGMVVGTLARLVVPFNEHGLGAVSFVALGQVNELPARKAPDAIDLDDALFTECVIDTIEQGVAVVRPADR